MTRQDSTGGSTLRGQGPGTARAAAVDGSSEASAEPSTAAEALAGRSVGETSESELLSAFLPLLQGEQIAVANSEVTGIEDTLDPSFQFRLALLGK